MHRRIAAWLAAVPMLAALGVVRPAISAGEQARRPPSLLFVLLDTTRADRFGAWGNERVPTPRLDALARGGARFARHFANAHATRSSMPQLMSGRYYHPNILRPLHSLSHPREYYFLDGDPAAALLPSLLRARGYRTLGVSAHPWVVAESAFGRGFDRLDFLPPPEAARGHVDARAVVDRALELWHARPRDVPVLLYVHLMDLHMPRWLPSDRSHRSDALESSGSGRPVGNSGASSAPDSTGRPDVSGSLQFAGALRWQDRFSPGSKPLFGRDRRRWDQADARDFTAEDRAIFAAFYDTLLAHTDAEVGRLLDEIRREDPDLESVAVVVVADHGEELGEEGRTDHTDSLADGVQHIPLIIAGGGVRPGQRFDRFSENVDVVPTIVSLLGLDPMVPSSAVDGRALLDAGGALCGECGRERVHYAWVTYEAIRTGAPQPVLLRTAPAATAEAFCEGRQLFALHGSARRLQQIVGPDRARAERLERRIRQRLGRRAARFADASWRHADRSFFVPARYWRLGSQTRLVCPRIDADAGRATLAQPAGWQFGRGSFFVLRPGSGAVLEITVAVPDGEYDVDLGIVPVGRLPWLMGFERWLRRGFKPEEAAEFVPVGRVRATDRRLQLAIEEQQGLGRRLVTLRLTPPDAVPASGESPELDAAPDYRDRLRALGYVE
jgi:arylsulfatase A-like enzyme